MGGRFGRRANRTLIATTSALLIVALLGVFAFELADTQSKSRQDVRARVHERGTLAAALIESLFESSAQQVPANTRRYGGRTVPDRILEAERRTSLYLVLLGPSRQVIASSRGLTPVARRGLATSPAVRRVAAGQPYGLSDVMPYAEGGAIEFAVAVPTPYGRRYLVTGFRPSALSGFVTRELQRIPGVDGAQNYLIDSRRRVISSTDRRRRAGYRFTTPDQVAALARESGTAAGFYYDQVRLKASGWRLVLAAPEEGLFKNVSGLRKWVPWMIFAAFAAATAGAFLLARRLVRTAADARRANALLALSNAELERRATELARSNDELDQFASIASHDLQEPLRKVQTFTERLTVTEADRLSEKGRDYLLRTNAAAERMQHLIEDLLRFSRVATETTPFAPVDLEALMAEVLDDLSHEIEQSGATIEADALPTVSGDALQLRQLLQNLLSNALKFRRPDTAPHVRLTASVTPDSMVLVVADDGVGFDPEYAERIFRVFERLHGRSQYPGTGIGLALCRRIAERHGGSITADGRPGQGACFTVTLPLDQRHAALVLGGDADDMRRARAASPAAEDRAHA